MIFDAKVARPRKIIPENSQKSKVNVIFSFQSQKKKGNTNRSESFFYLLTLVHVKFTKLLRNYM